MLARQGARGLPPRQVLTGGRANRGAMPSTQEIPRTPELVPNSTCGSKLQNL